MKRPIFAGGSLYKSADKFIRVSSDPCSKYRKGDQTKISTSKMHHSVENACINWMWQLGLYESFKNNKEKENVYFFKQTFQLFSVKQIVAKFSVLSFRCFKL